jgi:lipopolysaccharide/colanic/teichoic acid biosynthesis glycosyltransferase
MKELEMVETGQLPRQTSTQRGGLNDFACDAIDYMLTAVAIFIFLPVYLALAIIVKLDSRGPVFHRRRVMGRDGKEFDAFKFRTMVVNGDEVLAAHPELKAQWLKDQKLKVDPRITRSGQWMRKLSLDELPQLFNVMLGQMSLVGPRMFTRREIPNYNGHADEVLTTKPGITGLWQISGRSDLGRDDRVRLDLQYVRTRTVWLNIKLILMTVPAVLLGRGAY